MNIISYERTPTEIKFFGDVPSLTTLKDRFKVPPLLSIDFIKGEDRSVVTVHTDKKRRPFLLTLDVEVDGEKQSYSYEPNSREKRLIRRKIIKLMEEKL